MKLSRRQARQHKLVKGTAWRRTGDRHASTRIKAMRNYQPPAPESKLPF